MYVCVFVCVCVCVYIYIYICTITNTHAHIYQGCIRADVTAVTNSQAADQDERDLGPQNALSHGEVTSVK